MRVTAPTPAGTIDYLTIGHGDRVVCFLPGADCLPECAAPMLASIGPGVRAIAPWYPVTDQPGELLTALTSMLRHAGCTALHVLVGHSLGGMIAQLGLDHGVFAPHAFVAINTSTPEWLLEEGGAKLQHRLDGLRGTEALAFFDAECRGTQDAMCQDVDPAWTPLVRDAMSSRWTLEERQAMTGLALNLGKEYGDGVAAVPQTVPTLLIHSRDDTVISRGWRERLRRRFDQADEIALASGGHWATISRSTYLGLLVGAAGSGWLNADTSRAIAP